MDSDFQHDPADLPALVAPLGAGYDAVIGSRYVPGGEIPDWAPLRRMISRTGNWWADCALALGVSDSTAGFRAYTADLLVRMNLATVRARGYGFQIEMTYRARGAGARILEIPITFHERERGTSKMSAHTVVEAFGLVTWWGFRRRSRRLLTTSKQP
jgi:glycosyltransferase involved in cell wall biosynthesis